MTTPTRTLAVFAAGALVSPLISLGSPAFAAGEATPPSPRSVADLCQNVPAGYEPFTDVPEGNTFKQNIECLAFSEITKGGPGGLPEDQYGPTLVVRRDAMASFIARMIDTADAADTGDNIKTLPPSDGVVTFTDVTPGNTHRENIDRLADAGIVNGGPGGRPQTQYGPELEVTRAQMASFIKRALEYMTGESYETADDYFTDDEGSTHEGNINAVASLAVATGVDEDTFRPAVSVNRQQMSAFLTRGLAVLEAGGLITPLTAGVDDIAVTPDAEQSLQATANPDQTAEDDRTYQVAGLVEGVEYRVSLVLAENYNAQDGTFRASADERSQTGFSADTGNPSADIVTVDGAATDDTDTTTGGFQNGSTTFTATGETASFAIDGDAGGEQVLPVVYRNGGDGRSAEEGGTSPRLEVDASAAGEFGAPVEPFDVGGVTAFAGPAGNETVTTRPELVSVELVETREEGGQLDPLVPATQVTDVRFTFDEPVTGAQAPDPALFHLVGFDSANRYDGVEAVVEEDENSVLVTFGQTPVSGGNAGQNVGEAELAEISLATVDAGAVQDVDDEANPIGDRPFGESRTDTRGQAGVTAAPDLLSVGGFTSPAGQQTTQVTFTFDQNAFTVEPTGFHLVTANNQDVACTAVEGVEGGQTAEADETVVANCQEPEGANLTAADVARGYVEPETVASEQATAAGQGGSLNPLQSTQEPDANSTGPDLVSTTFDVENDTATYTFDAAVRIANAAAPEGGTDPDGADGSGDFRVYPAEGGPGTAGTAATRSSSNTSQVVVTFADGTLADAVGASVAASAVEAATTASAGTNQPDEVGVENTSTTELTIGETDGPDLQTVSVLDDGTAVFTFDEPVTGDTAADADLVVEAGFSLYLADGTRLACGESAVAEGQPNSVTCSAFTVDVERGGAATDAQVQQAVLGTVDNGSVGDTEETPNENPEGAEVTTGSTGTPSA